MCVPKWNGRVMKKIPLKIFDIPVIVLTLTVTAFIAVKVYSGDETSSRIIIRSQDKTWVFPLNAEELVIVPGPIGDTIVHISGGRAAILSSPCSGQTCVAAGEIHGNGQWAACLPNRVFLLVEGTGGAVTGNRDAVDAASW